jgi:hypothetical protein
MEKLVYLLFQHADVSGDELRDTLIQKVAPTLREGGASQIAVNVHDSDVVPASAPVLARYEDLPAQRWLSDPPVRAMVSFWMNNSDDRARCEQSLAPHAHRLCGYIVAESIPLENTAHPVPLGHRTPGFNQVACITKKRSISFGEFYDLWLDDQKRVAMNLQCTFGYKRNAIMRPLTASARGFNGIVEESFPMQALTDPLFYYETDSQEEWQRRVNRMIESCQRFLEMEEIDTTPMSEYLLG